MENNVVIHKTIFNSPLIVYKISSEVAYNTALKLCEYLLLNNNIKQVIVEDTSKINLEVIAITNKEVLNTNTPINALDIETNMPDLCITLGGDGTTLWANSLFKHYDRPPFLTFNLGTLGYMAIYFSDSWREVMDEMYKAEKEISYEQRGLIEGKILNKDKKVIWKETALNDIVIDRSKSSHMSSLKIFINDEFLTNVRCDGLIFSTATGSTAYSLSAGGSIVHYDVDCLIVNSICPHSLSFRPIVLPRGVKISAITFPNFYSKVSNDGIDNIEMEKGGMLEIGLSDKFIDFIVLPKFTQNRLSLWKRKLVQQLGWNKSFAYQ